MTDGSPMPGSRKLFVKTFGCQMNVYDSERMGETLGAEGYAATSDIADADVILLNTCHIREKAAEKIYSQFGRLGQLKERRAADGKRDADRGGGLRGAGRGRARSSSARRWSISWSARRAITACRS